MRVIVSPELPEIARPGIPWLHGATVVERDVRLEAPLAEAEARVRMHPPAEVAAVRTIYTRVGLDPTRNRPSSEALLRRVRKGGTLPRIWRTTPRPGAVVNRWRNCSCRFGTSPAPSSSPETSTPPAVIPVRPASRSRLTSG